MSSRVFYVYYLFDPDQYNLVASYTFSFTSLQELESWIIKKPKFEKNQVENMLHTAINTSLVYPDLTKKYEEGSTEKEHAQFLENNILKLIRKRTNEQGLTSDNFTKLSNGTFILNSTSKKNGNFDQSNPFKTPENQNSARLPFDDECFFRRLLPESSFTYYKVPIEEAIQTKLNYKKDHQKSVGHVK